ncbi:MipA/OmpV family protein [Pantoea sp. EA-12]|uniref:MipA/OmpV family protein n=1 Tax=Pantoea sp. EA-12 TaxID=3043303 RepID=UPI0024B49F89|nr:MipA/OmpV family protein [Pantoea sp. EA-12]MDI9221542.1 MipA/OmpV family protein [Pantoea sp. EA-12]
MRYHIYLITPLLFCFYSNAEPDLSSLGLISEDRPDSPIPKGFIVGGAAISSQARYHESSNDNLVVPGALYFGDNLMFLGDRARYYFNKNDDVAYFGYGRYRFSNLNPSDDGFHGMHKRKGELEGGVGLTWITNYALLTTRIVTDISGQSNGQELLVWADFPVIRDKFLFMPGLGVVIRSEKLANYYFGGVSSSESSPERAAWNAGTTLSPMASVVTSYRFNQHWIGLIAANYEYYDKGIANSPLVQHNGEWLFITGIGYSW